MARIVEINIPNTTGLNTDSIYEDVDLRGELGRLLDRLSHRVRNQESKKTILEEDSYHLLWRIKRRLDE